jgi:hypothetical protein
LHEYAELPIHKAGFDGFLAGAILLFAFSKSKSRIARAWKKSFWLPAWLLVACGMYLLVWTHWRYVAVFLLLLCLEVFRALVFCVERRVAVRVCGVALLVAMTPLALIVARSLWTTVEQFRHPVDEDYVAVAHHLQNLGLQPGDRLAIIGAAGHPYYARYDRLRLVAQILDADEFWRLNPADAKRVEDRMASIGVKGLLAFDRPANFQQGGWLNVGPIDGKPLNLLFLRPAAGASH